MRLAEDVLPVSWDPMDCVCVCVCVCVIVFVIDCLNPWGLKDINDSFITERSVRAAVFTISLPRDNVGRNATMCVCVRVCACVCDGPKFCNTQKK